MVAALAVLLVVAPAHATRLVLADGTVGPQPWQGWADHALVPTPPGDVTLALDGCAGAPGMAACSPLGAEAISLSPDWDGRHVFLHELGHVFDDLMPPWARERFKALIHRRGAWAPTRAAGPPNEQFAEAYALCAVRPFLSARTYEAYGYAPSPGTHDRVCTLIRRAGVAMTPS